MTYYRKPHDVTYTQMCIWIDNNIYNDDCNDSLAFEYLYHITRMLAYKRHFFEKAEYYDDFAIYCATRIFMRLKDKRQFDSNEKLTKIKSVLNYAKSILYATKVSFEGEVFAQNYVKNEDDIIDFSFHSSLIDTLNSLHISNFKSCLDDISNTIKKFINTIPSDSNLYRQRVYTSCILSLLNSITLSEKNKSRLIQLRNCGKLTQENVYKLYKKERDDCVILYHLDDTKKDYIKVLVNEIRHLIADDLSGILNEYVDYESNIKSILISSINMDLKQDNDEYD